MRCYKLKLYLGMVLFIAAILRFYGLADRGLFYADETRYYRDAVRAKEAIRDYFARGSEKGIRQFFTALSPIAPQEFAQKPGNSTLGMIGLFVFGDHQYSVLFVSAILGVVTVLLIFLMGYKFYGSKIGLIAALLLAVCPPHILFSRSFLTHTNQAFFIILAACLYLFSDKHIFYAGSAICLGYAFLVHPSGLIYFLPFILREVFLWFRKKRVFKEVLLFFVLFLLPFLTIEAISALGKKEFGSLAIALKGSYAQQLFLTSSSAAGYGTENNRNLGPIHLIIMTVLSNGPLFTLAWVFGGMYYFFYSMISKRRQLCDFIFGVVPIALFFYWQFISVHERLFREIVFLFPFFCVIAASLISRFGRRIVYLLVAMLFLEGLWYSAKVISLEKSEYPRIEKFLADNKIDRIMTPSEYLATTQDVLMPHLKGLKIYRVSSLEEMKDLRDREGIYYCMIFPGEWILNESFRFSSGPPVAQAAEPTYVYFPFFYESIKAMGKKDYLKYYRDNKNALMVSVYNMRKERL